MDSAKVEARGLELDRRWMLTDPDGMFLTQRQFPRMATIGVVVDGGQLIVESEGAGSIAIPFEPDRGEWRRVTIWQSVCDAEAYSGAVSEWFSDVLRTRCQLVRMPDASRRSVNPLFDHGEDIVSFADGYPLLAISEASLADVNERLAANAELGAAAPIPMNRFRPNVVVAGSMAFEEDDWKRVRIGEAVFRSAKPCARCVVTTVDQTTGKLDGKEPLRTLASYRTAKDVMPERLASLGLGPNDVLFGQNLIPENPGAVIRLNDRVNVL